MYPWPKRTLFMGRLLEPLTVCYGAATLLVSLGRPVMIAVAGRATQGCSFLLPAGMQVTINAGSEIMAIFHLDVLGDDFKRFQGCFSQPRGAALLHGLSDEADYRAVLANLYHQPVESTAAHKQLDDLLEYSFSQVESRSLIDPQVMRTVDHIKLHFQDNIPIGELARRVHLSTPSLVRKFKQQSGVPIRRFRLWHRIYESMIFISEGQSLTDAALSAGFSDSSHYTHTLQAMWGVSPSCLFSRGIGARIVPPED
jgi:AraC-like DNA-binding protein